MNDKAILEIIFFPFFWLTMFSFMANVGTAIYKIAESHSPRQICKASGLMIILDILTAMNVLGFAVLVFTLDKTGILKRSDILTDSYRGGLFIMLGATSFSIILSSLSHYISHQQKNP